MIDVPAEPDNERSDRVYTSDGPMCCHGCGYKGDEASYPDPDADDPMHFELDDEGLFVWHDPACPKCGAIYEFGHIENCLFGCSID